MRRNADSERERTTHYQERVLLKKSNVNVRSEKQGKNGRKENKVFVRWRRGFAFCPLHLFNIPHDGLVLLFPL